MASEVDNKDWGVQQAPYSLNEYSRDGSTITIEKTPSNVTDVAVCNDPDVTCINAVFSTASAQFDCTDTTVNGGWGTPSWNGQCWTSLQACYYYGTPSEVCHDLTSSNQNLPSHIANHTINVSSLCSAPDAKGVCYYENAGAAKIRSNTGDDMFAITHGASGYIEYPALGAIGAEDRLIYILRNGGDITKDLMIPSGPPGNFQDYKNFMSSSPPFITAEAGCYQLDVNLCQGDVTLPPPPPPPCPDVAVSAIWRAHGTKNSNIIFSGPGGRRQNNCPAGYTPTELGDDSDSKHSITEDDYSGGDRMQLCVRASDPTITIKSEWRLGGCSADMVHTGVYDRNTSGGKTSKYYLHRHDLPEEENGADELYWCLGIDDPSGNYELKLRKAFSSSCNADEARLVQAHGNEWNLNDEDGSINRAVCAKIEPKAAATCP